MKYIDMETMRKLSFPDFEVEKIELSFEKKMLKIVVEDAWLDEGKGIKLGKGTLFFYNWESLAINRFDALTKTWSNADNEFPIEELRDLCEVQFFDSTICLSGFGKLSKQWMEWKIVSAKMHAEFE